MNDTTRKPESSGRNKSLRNDSMDKYEYFFLNLLKIDIK